MGGLGCVDVGAHGGARPKCGHCITRARSLSPQPHQPHPPTHSSYVSRLHPQTTIFWTDVYGYPTPWPRFSPLHKLSAEQRAFLDALMRGQGEHRIVGGPAYSTWFNTQSRLVTRLREEGVRVSEEVGQVPGGLVG